MHVPDVPRPRTSHESLDADWIVDHLIHDHGRSPHEISGLPPAAVHDLEHVDESLGLLYLHHCHL
jgi:hypothetical protein